MPSYEDNGWKKYDDEDDDRVDIGEQIRRAVASSTDWINDVIYSVRNGVIDQQGSTAYKSGKTPEDMRREAEKRARRQQELDAERARERDIETRVGHVSSGIGHGILQIIGSFFTGLFGILTITGLLIWFVGGSPSTFFVFLIIAIFCGNFSSHHTKQRRQLKRFVRYTGMIQDKLYVEISDFVNSLGYSKKRVLRDLRKMIELGILKQAHIDSEEKYLMLSDETYEQYLQAQESFRQRERVERADEELKEAESRQQRKNKERAEARSDEQQILSEIEARKKKELDDILTKGRGYIKQIREANDEIKGEEISAKLDRLETVAGQIFTIVSEHPEKVNEIHKFMDYYLPTALKLVKNYHEFDMQPVQGENITKAKKEIEDTLDMINLAFENLSDRLYQDVAMEVSADISVLQSLLAQEGLKDKDFIINK